MKLNFNSTKQQAWAYFESQEAENTDTTVTLKPNLGCSKGLRCKEQVHLLEIQSTPELLAPLREWATMVT